MNLPFWLTVSRNHEREKAGVSESKAKHDKIFRNDKKILSSWKPLHSAELNPRVWKTEGEDECETETMCCVHDTQSILSVVKRKNDFVRLSTWKNEETVTDHFFKEIRNTPLTFAERTSVKWSSRLCCGSKCYP